MPENPESQHSRFTPAALLLGLGLLLAPLSQAHTGGNSLGVVIPPPADCPNDAPCIEQFTLNGSDGAIQPGSRLDLMVWNDDDEPHQAFVTLNRSADPEHQATPTQDALTHSSRVPGESSRASEAWTFTTPTDAEALYVWCGEPGHEEAGEWMVLELGPGPGADAPGIGVASLCLTLLGVALLIARRPGPLSPPNPSTRGFL